MLQEKQDLIYLWFLITCQIREILPINEKSPSLVRIGTPCIICGRAQR